MEVFLLLLERTCVVVVVAVADTVMKYLALRTSS